MSLTEKKMNKQFKNKNKDVTKMKKKKNKGKEIDVEIGNNRMKEIKNLKMMINDIKRERQS